MRESRTLACNCIWICRLLCSRSVFWVLFFPSSAAGPVHPERRCRRNVVRDLFCIAFLAGFAPVTLPGGEALLLAVFSHASFSLSVPPAGCAGQSGPGAACAVWPSLRRGGDEADSLPVVNASIKNPRSVLCCARDGEHRGSDGGQRPGDHAWTDVGKDRPTMSEDTAGARQAVTQDRRRAARVCVARAQEVALGGLGSSSSRTGGG